MLCDLWFYPRMSLVIKAIVWPFISKPDPDKAIKTFDQVPEDIKEIFVTKGVVNLFPKNISKVILPKELYHQYKVGQYVHGNYEVDLNSHKYLPSIFYFKIF